MMRAAVLGRPIGHSLSPVLHRAAYASLGLDWRFDALEVGDDAGLRALLDRCDAEGDWAGLALTMPLKKLVLPLLDEVSATAVATGAANTVLFSPAGVDGRAGRRRAGCRFVAAVAGGRQHRRAGHRRGGARGGGRHAERGRRPRRRGDRLLGGRGTGPAGCRPGPRRRPVGGARGRRRRDRGKARAASRPRDLGRCSRVGGVVRDRRAAGDQHGAGAGRG